MARVQKAAAGGATPARAKTAGGSSKQASTSQAAATTKGASRPAPSPAKQPKATAPRVAVRKEAATRPARPAPRAEAARPVAEARRAEPARPAKKAASKTAPRKEVGGLKVPADKFLAEQQGLLIEERKTHLRQAESLKEEADTLAAEMEPGESEFGEEGGEGGNLSIERELDLALSAQAKAAVDEIDRALVKIHAGTYGVCEKCGKEIPKARLRVLPHAPLCVACKSGGLSRR